MAANDFEAMDRSDLLIHASVIGRAAELINVASAYLNSPDGSGEEEIAEAALVSTIGEIEKMSGGAMQNFIMALASVIVASCDGDEVQAWFDNQSDHIKAALK